MAHLIDFLYTDNYGATPATETHDIELVVHTKVYTIAEKFNIQGLKDLACEKFKAGLSKEKLDVFTFVLQQVHENTPESESEAGLRGLRMDFAAIHYTELIDRGEFFNFCKEVGEFTATLLREVAHALDAVSKAETPPSVSTPSCLRCGSLRVVRQHRGRINRGVFFDCSICKETHVDYNPGLSD